MVSAQIDHLITVIRNFAACRLLPAPSCCLTARDSSDRFLSLGHHLPFLRGVTVRPAQEFDNCPFFAYCISFSPHVYGSIAVHSKLWIFRRHFLPVFRTSPDTSGGTPLVWGISPSQYLYVLGGAQHSYTSVTPVGFEPTNPVLQRPWTSRSL